MLLLLSAGVLWQSCGTETASSGQPRVLVFSKTAGFRHESIGPGKRAIQKLGAAHGFTVDTTENSAYFSHDSLKKYRAVIFLSTSGDVLNPSQENALMQFMQQGGGFVGIHAAADTEYDWPWYGNLVGAYFKNHPKPQQARLIKVKSDRFDLPAPDPWVRFDEWYNFKNIAEHINVLFWIDESSYEGGENGKNHPMVWYHEYDGGRVFYTGMGHTSESFEEPDFLEHLLKGIGWAVGS
jgi:type 1 glutamine amidotransferase